MSSHTRFEHLVALHVTDEDAYTRYRAGMTPLLAEFGGAFRYDFRGAEVLKSEPPAPINRVFVLSFPNSAAGECFFADERYLKVRAAHFDSAVAAVTRIAAYERTITDDAS